MGYLVLSLLLLRGFALGLHAGTLDDFVAAARKAPGEAGGRAAQFLIGVIIGVKHGLLIGVKHGLLTFWGWTNARSTVGRQRRRTTATSASAVRREPSLSHFDANVDCQCLTPSPSLGSPRVARSRMLEISDTPGSAHFRVWTTRRKCCPGPWVHGGGWPNRCNAFPEPRHAAGPSTRRSREV